MPMDPLSPPELRPSPFGPWDSLTLDQTLTKCRKDCLTHVRELEYMVKFWVMHSRYKSALPNELTVEKLRELEKELASWRANMRDLFPSDDS